MILRENKLIRRIGNQVRLEPQAEGNVQGEERPASQPCQLHEPDPFQHAGVFVEDFALLEV